MKKNTISRKPKTESIKKYGTEFFKGLISLVLLSTILFSFVSCECNHEFKSSITKEPTYTEEGEKKYTCTKCGYSYTETISKLKKIVYLKSFMSSIDEVESKFNVFSTKVPYGANIIQKSKDMIIIQNSHHFLYTYQLNQNNKNICIQVYGLEGYRSNLSDIIDKCLYFIKPNKYILTTSEILEWFENAPKETMALKNGTEIDAELKKDGITYHIGYVDNWNGLGARYYFVILSFSSNLSFEEE